MKLLFVSNLFPDTRESWRGLDNVTLLHALRQQEPGLEVRVLAFRPTVGWPGPLTALKPRPGDEVLDPSYHKAAYIPKFGGLNDRLFAFSLAWARKALDSSGFQPDAILAPWLFPDACAVAACFPQAPLVAVAQGSDVHQYLRLPMRRRAILKLCGRARAIVTRSQDLRHRLVSGGADAGRVHALYNGVHQDVFRPASRPAAREQLQLPAEGRVVLFVGNFLPVKGIDLLLEAFALVAKSSAEPATLALIGSGPLEAALKQQAAQLGIGDRLLFVGRQPPQTVALWMQAANAVCLSSHNEGVPNVVLEAVSSGRPMVSTDVGGIAEIIEPLMSRRFLVPGRDPAGYAAALADALDHPPEEEVLHAKARQYSWENCARSYLALLR